MGHDEGVDYEVVVVGAGFSGIGAGIRLLDAGIDSFVILERAGDLGGTWRDATYPGVAVDVPGFTYSFSFEQNPGWSRVYPPGSEILGYAHHCADKYGLRPHMRFGAEVIRMAFDEDGHRWRVHLAAPDGGREGVIRARFVIGATGALVAPRRPALAGLDRFRGVVLHSARWDHDVDLRGKRLAVVGTGASAVQLVPALAAEASHISVFQRTPIWVLPRRDRPIAAWQAALFRRVRAAQWLYRLRTTLRIELFLGLGLLWYRRLPGIVRWIERASVAHLRRQVADPGLRRDLTPRTASGASAPRSPTTTGARSSAPTSSWSPNPSITSTKRASSRGTAAIDPSTR